MLGRGGMGVVYKARHLALNRIVALKMILAGEPRRRGASWRRFRTEAEAVARLQHPNIVQIYEVGERERPALLLAGVLDGGSLAEQARAARRCRRGRRPRLVETLARADARWPTSAASSTAT